MSQRLTGTVLCRAAITGWATWSVLAPARPLGQRPSAAQAGTPRDPFVPPGPRGPEPAGSREQRVSAPLALRELELHGVVRGAGVALAIVAEPDGTVHILRPGSPLADGVVRSIVADGVLVDRGPDAGTPAGVPPVRLGWRRSGDEP